MRRLSILAVVIAALPLSACISTQPRQPLQGPVFNSTEIRSAQTVMYATVVGVQPIVIQSPIQTSWQGTAGSGAVGGLIGAGIGSKIGKGNGKKLATAVGGIGGAAAGIAVRDELAKQESQKQGVELQVRLNDGTNRILSVIQEVSNTERFFPNQTVSLVQQRGGYHASPI